MVEKYRMWSPSENCRLRRMVLTPVVALGTKTTVLGGALMSDAMAERDSFR